MCEISVIVPYYKENREVFGACVNSILLQSFKDYEVIVVNDNLEGTGINRDDLLSVCRKDKRIRLIEQKNQGVSVARNVGVRESRGKYVVFVDADDLVVPEFFEEAFSVAENYNADIVYGFECMTNDESFVPQREDRLIVNEANEEWLKKYTIGYSYNEGNKKFGRGPYVRLIRAEIAKEILFDSGISLGEDVLWNIRVIEKAKRKYIVDKIWYLYMIRNDSTTRKFRPNIEVELSPFYEILKEFVLKDEVYSRNYYYRLIRDLRVYIFGLYLGSSQNKEGFIHRWHEFNAVCDRDPWKDIGFIDYKTEIRGKEKIKVFLFKYKLLFVLFSVLNKI